MNKRIFYSTIATIFTAIACFASLHEKEQPHQDQPKQSVIIFDLDGTIIHVPPLKQYATIAKKAFPWHISALYSIATGRARDKDGNKRFKVGEEFAPGGGATALAFYGIKQGNKALQELIPTVLEITWGNDDFVPGAKTLLDYLQSKNYPIAYATNKDYVSYVEVAQRMNAKYNNAFTKYPTFVLVTQPRQDQLNEWYKIDATMPGNFKELIAKIKNPDNETNAKKKNIFFAQGNEKPEASYFNLLKELITKHIPNYDKLIFFDDKKNNTDIAQKQEIISYSITTVTDIVNGLETAGILDPERDKFLYDALATEGVFGLKKRIWHYFIYLKSLFSGKGTIAH